MQKHLIPPLAENITIASWYFSFKFNKTPPKTLFFLRQNNLVHYSIKANNFAFNLFYKYLLRDYYVADILSLNFMITL